MSQQVVVATGKHCKGTSESRRCELRHLTHINVDTVFEQQPFTTTHLSHMSVMLVAGRFARCV